MRRIERIWRTRCEGILDLAESGLRCEVNEYGNLELGGKVTIHEADLARFQEWFNLLLTEEVARG